MRSDEMKCGGAIDADSASIKNKLRGNMTGRVRGKRGVRETDSLDSHSLEYYSQELQRYILGINELFVLLH